MGDFVYSFGGILGESNEGNDQRYRYNGKEYESLGGLNMHDYGARYYDQTLGRWHVMDEMAEKYYNISPYAYCANNPVNAIDPDGRYITYVNGKRSYIYSKGNFYVNNRTKGKDGIWTVSGAKVFVPKSTNHMYRTLQALRKMDNSRNPYVKKVFDTVSDVNGSYEHRIIKENTEGSHASPIDFCSLMSIQNYDDVDFYEKSSDFNEVGLADYELLGHEIKHSYNQQFHKSSKEEAEKTGISMEEIDAVNFENIIRKEENKEIRKKYTNNIPNTYLNSKFVSIWK